MMQLALRVSGAALAWLVILGALVYALKRRALARFENGLFLSTVIGIVGIALMAATVVGVWGYFATKQILDQELVVELQDVGGIVDAQINGDIQDIESDLNELGQSLVDPLTKHEAPAALTGLLEAARNSNPRYLQLRLLDPTGGQIAAATQGPAGAFEPINRIAVGFNLAGQPFVSEAYFSDIFKREALHVSLPVFDKAHEIRGLLSVRFDLQNELEALTAGSRFNQSGYAVVVDGEGQIVGHPDPARLEEDVSKYAAVRAAWATSTMGEVTALNDEDVERLFVYRAIHNPATLGKRPWVLLTEIDPSEELAPLRRLEEMLAGGVALLLLASVLIAYGLSWSITRPMEALGLFARKIVGGDLASRVDVSGRDVAGRLANTLNTMAAGLQERDHVKEVFGRYIATQVSDKILRGEANLGGESRRVTILFSDIRNFTTMSEQMKPSQVVTFLNEYFSEMVDAVFDQRGILDKFLGDGLMAVFGALDEGDDHPARAVLAALRMKALLAKINGERAVAGKPPIAIGVGVHTDEVIVGNIATRKRLEYTVIGDGVNTCSRLQGLNKDFGTTILISETTYAAIKDGFECRQMPDAHLRGKVNELKFYEVISAKREVVEADFAGV